jgi:hypothetical protein
MPVLVLLAVGLAGLMFRRERGLSRGCTKCGLPVSRRVSLQVCDQCQSVFFAAERVDPSARAAKEEAVRRYQVRRRRLERGLATVAGAAQLLGGQPALGLALLLGFGFCSAMLFFPSGLGVDLWALPGAGLAARLVRVLGALGMLVLGVASVRRALEK